MIRMSSLKKKKKIFNKTFHFQAFRKEKKSSIHENNNFEIAR